MRGRLSFWDTLVHSTNGTGLFSLCIDILDRCFIVRPSPKNTLHRLQHTSSSTIPLAFPTASTGQSTIVSALVYFSFIRHNYPHLQRRPRLKIHPSIHTPFHQLIKHLHLPTSLSFPQPSSFPHRPRNTAPSIVSKVLTYLAIHGAVLTLFCTSSYIAFHLAAIAAAGVACCRCIGRV